MNITPWKSTSVAPVLRSKKKDELSSFMGEVNSLMNSFFNKGDFMTPQLFDTAFYPAIDLIEKDNKYLLDAEVPGMKESDINIDLHNNILTIKGKKKLEETEFKDADCVCSERSAGSFRRDIYLEDAVDQSNIKADLKDGVLHLELTKQDASKVTKKIQIKH